MGYTVDDLQNGVAFKGKLGDGEIEIPVRFRARLDRNGHLSVRTRALPMTAEAFDLDSNRRIKGGVVPFFRLEGLSEAGTSFATSSATIRHRASTTNSRGSTLAFKFECSRALLSRPRASDGRMPVVRQTLHNFECWGMHEVPSPLGRVALAGVYPLKGPDRLTGHLQIIADKMPTDVAAWRSEVERLFDHIRNVMSFALSRPVKAPLQQVWAEERWELAAYSQTISRRNVHPVFHPMVLTPIFGTAVGSFFNPPIAAKKLEFALEWFAMEAGYTESRLLNAVMALENLVDSNLSDKEKFALPSRKFEKLAKEMRSLARTQLARDEELNEEANCFLDNLPGKMADLNRRPLQEKLNCLAALWNVPLFDLAQADIAKAIKARNAIVHQGHYYSDPLPPQAERDLWDHVFIMREVIIRFVLTALGFSGTYLSFRDGQDNVQFPPVPRQTATEANS